ncbi:MAG: sensor histidine kinase [Acidobacteria bacterium]|nr:sensor histidine kinase [Acidobacteriota bacterium]
MVTSPIEQPFAAELVSETFNWTKAFAIARLILAVFGFALALAGPGQLTVLWSCFTLYAAGLLRWRRMDRHLPTFRLLVDTVFLLLCAALPAPYAAIATALFYLFVLLAAALLHTMREVLLVVTLSIVFFYLARPTEIVAFPPALLLAGIAVAVMALQKKALQERLAAATRQAVMSRSEVEHAREDERQRMAADFHDGPLQSFVGLQMRLEVVRKLLDRDPNLAREEILQLQELLKAQSAELRTFVRSMRPVEVDGAGLVPSLRKLVEGFGKESGMSASFVGGNTRVSPDSQTSLELLQIVREALHNVQKHSKASRVTVGVGRDGNALELSVEDDGTGFPFSGAYTLEELELLRLGPVSIRRRVRNLGGEMLLDSQPGKGASLKIRVPL